MKMEMEYKIVVTVATGFWNGRGEFCRDGNKKEIVAGYASCIEEAMQMKENIWRGFYSPSEDFNPVTFRYFEEKNWYEAPVEEVRFKAMVEPVVEEGPHW